MFTPRQLAGLIIGPSLFVLVLLLPHPPGLSPEAASVAAVALLMASFWIAETVPIPATAVLPIFLFPLLGVMPTGEVTRSYGAQILFLFMGGFLIAVTMQKWHLHRRIALNVILVVGSSQQRLVLGFMLATAGLSMWISNTATAMMMLPVATAVIQQTGGDREKVGGFGTALMLAIAYGASIGGVSTIVGTPPNAIFAGMAETLYGIEINFLDWMKIGVPVSVCMLFLCWGLLTRVMFRLGSGESETGARAHIVQELADMGSISTEEKHVALVFALVAGSWILKGLFNPESLAWVEDSAVAMAGAFLLFILPARGRGEFLLDWETARTIPWDIIILMGGGFALASGFSESGLTEWLAGQFSVLAGVHYFIILLAVVLMVTFLTEVSSNAATASLFLPVMGALAVSMDLHPLALMVPAAIAASMAFMMPVATPPNAIVFGSHFVTISQMARTGLWLNLLSALTVSMLCYFLLPVLTS